MERLRNALKQRGSSPAYEPLNDGSDDHDSQRDERKPRFSWLEYYIFLLLGIFMLWAWNMFLAASPYFQHRFLQSPSLLRAYSPSLLTVSTITNLLSVLVLSHIQSRAHYPHRVILSLILNTIAFTLLALSTVLFRNISDRVYFTFLMLMVFLSSIGTGICQNGVFAYVSGFGQEKYTQGIMTGQGVAGVLSCLAQIISVLSLPPTQTASAVEASDEPSAAVPQESGKSALAYFLTATFISLLTLFAFGVLTRRHPLIGISTPQPSSNPTITKTSPIDPPSTLRSFSPPPSDHDYTDPQPKPRKSVPLIRLYLKLHWLANAVFLSFTLTLFFPVFTQRILSTHPAPLPRLLQPSCFIPLAFLFWNAGDLVGRLLPLLPSVTNLTRWPKTVFAVSVLRVIWIPLYMLCDSRNAGHGGLGASDFFYLVVVQFGFGVSNGLLGSLCMMGSGVYVEDEEKEAAGGFMGLMLVGGLSAGSLLSFLVA